MMTISSTGIGQLDMTSMSKVGSKTKEQTEGCDAFASLMTMGSAGSTDEVEGTSKQEFKPVDTSKDIEREADIQSEDVYRKTTEPEKADGPEKVSDIPEEKSIITDSKQDTSDELISKLTSKLEDLEGTLGNALEELKTMLKELLGELKTLEEDVEISDAQLQDVLASMGYTMQNLLDESQLKSFILELNGATEVSILIDENLSNMINKYTSELENILQSNGIADVENLVAELENLTKQAEELSKTNMSYDNIAGKTGEKDKIITEKLTQTTESVPEAVTKNVKLADNKIEVNVSRQISDGDTENGTNPDTTSQDGYNDAKSQIMTNLNQAIENAVNMEGINDVSAFSQSISEADVVRQIIDNIKLNISKETTSIEMQLNPEQLGKVHITVASKDGIMQARIVAETEAAKNAIEGSIAALKEAFQNQELKVEAVEVAVATYEFFNQSDAGENQEQSSGTKKSNSVNLADLTEEELTEEDLIETEIMKAKGNSVSYSI